MSEESWILVVFVVCFTLGLPFGAYLGDRIISRRLDDELRQARIEKGPKLPEEARPFLVDFLTECRILLCEVPLEIKLLTQELLLKCVGHKRIQESAHNGADNGSPNANKDGFDGHSSPSNQASTLPSSGKGTA